MPDDSLRLRTARALRWVVEDDVLQDESRYMLLRRNGRRRTLRIQPDGSVKETRVTIPGYGTTWASCEEVITTIKVRKWYYEMEGSVDAVLVDIYDYETGGHIAGSDEETEPAAICEAFCRAVGASRE